MTTKSKLFSAFAASLLTVALLVTVEVTTAYPAHFPGPGNDVAHLAAPAMDATSSPILA